MTFVNIVCCMNRIESACELPVKIYLYVRAHSVNDLIFFKVHRERFSRVDIIFPNPDRVLFKTCKN